MYDIEALFKTQHREFYHRHPKLSKLLIMLGRKLWLEDTAKDFRARYPDAEGVTLLEKLFCYLSLDFMLDDSLQQLPEQGRLIVVANHPLGFLDGLGLLKTIARQRNDVKMLVNDGLHDLLGMPELTIGVDSFHGRISKNSFREIKQHLRAEGVLIIFPAGLVSRMSKGKIIDLPWNPSFVRFAKTNQTRILPVHIQARNSRLFYFLSKITDPIAKNNLFVRELMMMKLLREFLSYQQGKQITARYAPLVNLQSDCFADCDETSLADHIRSLVYQLEA